MKGKTLEMIGFIVEGSLFIMAGAFVLTNHWIAYFFLILALIMANIVGKQIARNAIEKYKENKLEEKYGCNV